MSLAPRAGRIGLTVRTSAALLLVATSVRVAAAAWLVAAAAGSVGAQAPEPAGLAEARALVRAGHLEAAAAAYTRLLDGAPQALDGLPDLEVRKERGRVLGWLGRQPEALADFDRVLAAAPRDVEARIGRGRVLGWMGRYAEAEAEFRRAAADEPTAADAYTGLGDVLGWQQRHADAAAAYARARSLAPRDPEPVLGLARLLLREGNSAGARLLYEEALRLDPGNADAKAGLARVAGPSARRRVRLDLGYRRDDLSDRLGDWHQESAQVTVRPWIGTALLAGVDQYHRFGADDTQATIGAAQDLPGRLTLAGAFTLGIDADVVARQVYDVEGSHRLAPWATPLLRYRRSNFPGRIHTDLVSPGLELTWAPYVSLLGRYYYTDTSSAPAGHAGSGRLTVLPEGRVSGYVGGAHGKETFLAGTVTQVAAGTDVTSLSAGLTWRLTGGSGVRLDYTYEDRRGSFHKHGIGTSFFVEF